MKIQIPTSCWFQPQLFVHKLLSFNKWHVIHSRDHRGKINPFIQWTRADSLTPHFHVQWVNGVLHGLINSQSEDCNWTAGKTEREGRLLKTEQDTQR